MKVALGKYLALPDGQIWYRDTGGSGLAILLLHPQTGREEVFNISLLRLQIAGSE